MSSFKTFNGYEVEDSYARKSVGALSKIAPAIGMVDGTGVTITDSAEGVAIDFDVYGRSTQDGEPTPTEPITPKSNGDMGYFDGELINGVYSTSNGIYGSNDNYLCNKNPIPCNASDEVTFTYHTDTQYNLMILFYDENMNYLSYKNTTTSDTLTATAPTNASYCNFNIGYGSALSVANASPITVTINDKYALIVDSVGKNKVDITTVKGMARISATADGNTIVVGAYPEVYGVYFDNSDVGLRVGETYTFSVENVDNYNASGGNGFRLGYADGTFGSMNGLEMTATIEKEVSTINFYLGTPYTGNLESRIKGLMIRPQGTDATYEPYKKSRKYIPISAPLRGIGEVTDVASLSECEITRRFAEVVFDGSDDEGWTVSGGFAIITVSDAISTNSTYSELICSHFRYVGQSVDVGVCFNYNQRFHFAITQSTLNDWLTWLQANPITVIYELAEPTTESIEPVDVDTFEGVTNISVSDNAGCKVSYYRNNEDGKKMKELDNRMVTAEDTINNLESNAVTVAGDIEDIKASMSENPLLVTLAPSDELPTIVAGSTVGSFKDTWLNRVINDYEYLIIVIRHRNGTKQIVQIPSMLLEIGGTYTFPFNDVQNNINGAYITLNSATRYGIGIFGTLPNDISFELYKYGRPISVG